MSRGPLLLAAPNVSEAKDREAVDAIARAFAPLRVLDVHSDADHARSVITLAGEQGEVAAAMARGAREALRRIDLRSHHGVHPRVGAVDVAPVVYLADRDRGAAIAEALTAAALIGELGVPVFLYGQLASAPEREERAALRSGGVEALVARLEQGAIRPDHGPPRLHPTAGATLVTARPPLVAFNLLLATDDLERARTIAASLREGDGGLPGVRALGLFLRSRGLAQVSFNVHDHSAAPLAQIVERVRAAAEVAEAELVGLAPAAALEGLPADLAIRGFDPDRHVIENALRSKS